MPYEDVYNASRVTPYQYSNPGGGLLTHIYEAHQEKQRVQRQMQLEQQREQLQEKINIQQNDLAIKLANSQAGIAAATKYGLTPDSPDFYPLMHQIAGEQIAQHVSNIAAISSPEGTAATKTGYIGGQVTPAVANAKTLQATAPQGGVTATPIVSGVNDKAPQIATGSTQSQTAQAVPLIRDPKTGAIIQSGIATTISNKPASVSTPITQEDIDNVSGAQLTPEDLTPVNRNSSSSFGKAGGQQFEVPTETEGSQENRSVPGVNTGVQTNPTGSDQSIQFSPATQTMTQPPSITQPTKINEDLSQYQPPDPQKLALLLQMFNSTRGQGQGVQMMPQY